MAAHAVWRCEVEVTTVKAFKIVAAGDLGTVVAPNPRSAPSSRAAPLMALGTALNEGMTFTDGMADQKNFSAAYQPLRHHQAPHVEVILFDHPKAPVGGSGEPPVPTLAPALANAIANATGNRVRTRCRSPEQGFQVYDAFAPFDFSIPAAEALRSGGAVLCKDGSMKRPNLVALVAMLIATPVLAQSPVESSWQAGPASWWQVTAPPIAPSLAAMRFCC